MERVLSVLVGVFKVLVSYIVALARLCVWTVLFFVSGFQRTIFMRAEIYGVDFKVAPLRCDLEETDEKLAYIDKLCMENPDLVETMEEKMKEEDDDFDFDDEDDDEGEE